MVEVIETIQGVPVLAQGTGMRLERFLKKHTVSALQPYSTLTGERIE